MGKGDLCPEFTEKKDEIKAMFSAEMLAHYIAGKTGEVVTQVNGKYSIGKKAGGGSISVFIGDDGFAAANDFAGSGVKGDCFAVIMHFENVGFGESVKIAADMVGLEIKQDRAEKPITKREHKADSPNYDKFKGKYRKDLRAGLASENAKEIAKRRGLDPDKLDCFDNFGFTDKDVNYTCLGKIPANSFVFWNDDEKTIKRVRFDIESGKRGDDKEEDYSQFGGNCHFTPSKIGEDGDVYLVEGEFDALALAQSCVKAIAIKPDSNTKKLIQDLSQNHRIILAYDNDKTGHEYTDKALKIIPGAIDISSGFDDGEDPNDFVAKHGANSLQALDELVVNAMNNPSCSPVLPCNEQDDALNDAVKAMNQCKKKVQKKDGSVAYEFERNDINPICEFLKVRGVYKELFTLDSGLRKKDGSELTGEELTREQLLMQKYGLPVMGTSGPKLCLQAAKYVCDLNKRDSLKELFEALPCWDGVDRISDFWQTYCGAVADSDSECDYLRSVARYMFTAIVGRALATRETPCKADMAIILEGDQGIGKSSLAKALCAKDEWFKTLSLDDSEDEIKRSLRMVQIAEIGEMGEPTMRQLQAIKRILSSSTLSMRKKGVDDFFYFPVRAFTIATIDQTDVLNDGAGARRWLPIHCEGVNFDAKKGKKLIDSEGVKRDLIQLYAQGKALFNEFGVLWHDIEAAAQSEHTASLTIVDERVETIKTWMNRQRLQCASLEDIAINCIGYTRDRFDRKAQRALGNALKLSGFKKVNVRVNGHVLKRWTHNDIGISDIMC